MNNGNVRTLFANLYCPGNVCCHSRDSHGDGDRIGLGNEASYERRLIDERICHVLVLCFIGSDLRLVVSAMDQPNGRKELKENENVAFATEKK